MFTIYPIAIDLTGSDQDSDSESNDSWEGGSPDPSNDSFRVSSSASLVYDTESGSDSASVAEMTPFGGGCVSKKRKKPDSKKGGKSNGQDSKLIGFDFTWHCTIDGRQDIVDGCISDMKYWCMKWCKKWCFQLEKAPTTGRLHLQGKVHLEVSQRLTALKKLIPKGSYFDRSSSHGLQIFSYVMKKDTRVDGPWDDRRTNRWVDPVCALKKPYVWQTECLARFAAQNNRQVLVIKGVAGNQGKSTMCMHLVHHKGALQIPPELGSSGKDIAQFVYSLVDGGDAQEDRAIVIDFPRADFEAARTRTLYASIETLKSGHIYDTRYKGKMMYIKPPKVVLFCNEMPHSDHLSKDRWDILDVSEYEDKVEPVVIPVSYCQGVFGVGETDYVTGVRAAQAEAFASGCIE